MLNEGYQLPTPCLQTQGVPFRVLFGSVRGSASSGLLGTVKYSRTREEMNKTYQPASYVGRIKRQMVPG